MEQPQSPRPSGIGGIGEMSTPEMLAKREQRRRMEAQAAALSRTSLSRRLLQPLQPQQRHASHQQPQQQLPNSLSGLASQPSGRTNMFSRAGLKRPAAAAAAPAPKAAAENAGVSAEELAKLMEDESTEDPRAAAPGEGVSCAKRPKLSDLLQQQQQQQQNNASTGGAGKPCFLTLQRQDQTTSVSAAFGRVAAQRQQQVGPERLQAVLPQQEKPQVSKQQDFVQHSINQQDAHRNVQMTTVDNRQQQQLMLQPSTVLEEPQAMAPANTTVAPAVAATAAATGATGAAPLEAAAAAGAGPAAAAAAAPAAAARAGAATAGTAAIPPLEDTSKRWLYVKPGSKPSAEQQAEPEPPTAAAGTGRRKQAANKAAQSKGSKLNQGSSGRSTTTARRKAPSTKAVAPVTAGSTDGAHGAAGQQPADAAADADAEAAGAPPAAAAARPPRPRRAAATRQSHVRSAAAAAGDSSAPEVDSSSGSSSGSDGGGSSDSGDDVTAELETLGKRGGRRQRKGRVVKGKAAAAAAADPAPSGEHGKAAAATRTSSRRAGGAAAADAGTGAAKPRAARRSSRATPQQGGDLQPPAPPRCTAKLSKQLQQLQDAVSNSRRVQQLSAAMLQEDDEQQQQQQQRQRDRPAAAGSRQPAGLATTHNRLLKQQQQLSNSAGQQQRPALQSHLPPELAAKVQAAIAAKAVPGAAPAAAAAAAVAAAAGSDGDLVLLDESDDLEIMDAAPGADTELLPQQQQQQQQHDVALTRQQQQQQQGAALKAEGLPGCDLMGVDDADVDMQLLEGSGSEGEALSGELCGDDGEEQEGGSSSSGWGDSGIIEGVADEEWDGEEPDDEEGEGAGSGGCSAGDESDWEVEDSKAPAAARKAAAKKGAAATGRSNRAATRTKRGKAAAAAAGDAAADSDAAAGDVGASAPKAKTRRSKTAAEGGVQKRKARRSSTAAADGSSKPKARKSAQRQNFKRHKTNAGGYGFKFMSKAAAKGGGKRIFRRVVNGKLLRGRRQAPHMAGQGAEFLEGFAGGGGGRGKGRCFTCGQAGHWQEECPLLAARVAEQEAELAAWMKDNPDAEEAQRVAGGNGDAYRTTAALDKAAAAAAGTGTGAAAGGVQGTAPAAAAAAARTGRPLQHQRYPQQPKRVLAPPLSQAQLCELAGLAPDAPWAPEQLTDEQLGSVLRGVWGHSGFRGQQLTLVRAALEGRSMLGVLPTGLGKSLTYQLPALLMQGLVVVVSPLLALMHDQVSRLPPGLPGAMLQASMDRQEVDEVLRAAESGQLRLLYVAPEKLGASHILSCLQRLPNLPLVCIDEAHCMAEWGEGFRPAYFRLGHLLVNVLRPRAILALTATAAPRTRNSIGTLLSLTEEQQVVESPLRDNLRLRVMHVSPGASLGGTVAAHMVQLFKSGEFCDAKSAVVYVTYKASAEGIAAQMMRAGITAAAYHGDMRMQQRETVQNAFLRGHLRVMVATVAFGMGMDKPDLEVVLHVNMPHSLEEYVQQVGRGGRDGRTAHCVLFLDDADYLKLRTLSHQRTAKRSSVEHFLRQVFIREDDAEHEDEGTAAAAKKGAKRRKPKLAPSQHRALALTSTSVELDLGEEVMESCLSFLQADPVEPYLAVLATVAETYDVRFHNTPPEELRKHHRVIDAILRAKTRKYAGTYKVHIPVLLSVEDRPPKELLDELSALAAAKELSVDSGRERALAWRLVRQPDDWDVMVDDVCARLENVVSASVSRLDRCYETLAGAAIYSSAAAQEQHLRCVIEDYFMQEQPQQQEQEPEAGTTAAAAVEDPDYFAPGADELPWGARHPVQRPSKESLLRQLRATMHAAGPRARDLGPGRFNGLVLARMVAGLSSPAVPKSFWKGCREFGRMEAVDFKLVLAAAEQVVQEFWAGEAGSRLRTMA